MNKKGGTMTRTFEVIENTPDGIGALLNRASEQHDDLVVESHACTIHPDGTVVCVVIVSWEPVRGFQPAANTATPPVSPPPPDHH